MSGQGSVTDQRGVVGWCGSVVSVIICGDFFLIMQDYLKTRTGRGTGRIDQEGQVPFVLYARLCHVIRAIYGYERVVHLTALRDTTKYTEAHASFGLYLWLLYIFGSRYG